MKLRVISDIHVEFYSNTSYIKSKLDKLFFNGKYEGKIIEDEILIIAGDLGVAGSGKKDLENSLSSLNPEYKSILEYFSQRWRNIILIPGNHEYYDRDKSCSLEDVDIVIEKECDKLGITFLNKNYVIIPHNKYEKDRYAQDCKIAILGCTLWSEATKEAYHNMNDRLKAILSHTELLKTHNEHKTWLKETLSKLHKKGIKTIVVTHHLPLMELTHPKYLSEKYKHLNSAYASRLDELFNQNFLDSKTQFESVKDKKNSKDSLIPFYCCGHTHEKTETKLYGTEFLINPLGYPREKRETTFKTQCVEI